MSLTTPIRIAVIVVAAGSGSRVGEPNGLPKQYRPIGGVAMIRRTLGAFCAHPLVDRVRAVIHPDHLDAYRVATEGISGLDSPVFGGASRQASVRVGLESFGAAPPDRILIHDAARPFVSPAMIERTILALKSAPAVLVATPVVDTLARTDADGHITDNIPRDRMWSAQTPQGFHFDLIRAAHAAAALSAPHDFTDDASVARAAGIPVSIVPGEPGNVKVTTAADLDAADRRCRMEDWLSRGDIRVGTGYDVHRFTEGDAVVLGGVRIAHDRKLEGHSDADVALHALTDAIFGALGDGDIGQHFPPSDPQWRGADSAVFLREAARRVAARGGTIAHADVNLIAEAPRIGPHREAMCARIADILGISIDRVGVKATTNERLGFIGRAEGIAAIATATIRLPFEPLA